jgi:glycosyltransferase involved in cell wall biosynthesis
MFVVHWTWWAPRLSGMYQSVKDQIKYERKAGIRSEFGDSHNPERDMSKNKDDWLTPTTWEEAKKADVWVLHGKVPVELAEEFKGKIPTVCVVHGPAEHMILNQWGSEQEDKSFTLTHINLACNYDAAVVINKHEMDILELFDENDKLRYIPNSIDLEEYPIDGYKWEYRHHPAIISCDVPRIEKLPMHILLSMLRVRARIPDAKLNLFALPLEPIHFWRNTICRSKKRELENSCENIQLKNTDLRPFMRGADIGFNNNYSGIASRVTMEMMAMGIPVVAYRGSYTKYHPEIFSLDSIAQQIFECWNDLNNPKLTVKEDTIKYAREHYDREKYIPQYLELYQELLDKK